MSTARRPVARTRRSRRASTPCAARRSGGGRRPAPPRRRGRPDRAHVLPVEWAIVAAREAVPVERNWAAVARRLGLLAAFAVATSTFADLGVSGLQANDLDSHDSSERSRMPSLNDDEIRTLRSQRSETLGDDDQDDQDVDADDADSDADDADV